MKSETISTIKSLYSSYSLATVMFLQQCKIFIMTPNTIDENKMEVLMTRV